MGQHAFRFGVVGAPRMAGQPWADQVRQTADRGYNSILAPDTTHVMSPFAALAAAATISRSLQVGTFVTASPFRTPGMLAWEAATLSTLSDGRFELGVGTGRPGSEPDAIKLGGTFGTAAERLARLEASLDEIDKLDETVRPRIVMAASGPKALAVAGRRADTIALAIGFTGANGVDQIKTAVRTVAEHAGDRFDEIEFAYNLVGIGEKVTPWIRDPDSVPRDSPARLTGSTRQMADELLRRRDELGISYVLTNPLHADELAPVVELLTGQ